ncbi:ribonuclease H-like domain-containing protein [Hyaloscypha finlandica]|nr:ribonuclease H-like domain-containing protein [Hyaloscypha finlandica]
MDIDHYQYRKKLLEILRSIANASFVTFDLEMSGISTRPKPGDRTYDVGKATLQQQYDEIKSAAETFQILQMGLTCVEEDREKEYYLARPYNFYVSPKSAEGVDLRLDRIFSFSSSACDFLTKNNFSFGKVFSDGVPYMSRDEEYECREEFNQRADKKAKMENITIASNDSATLDFYRGVRRTITMWHKTRKPKADFVNISHPDGNLVALNGFQRRLVYQLVRNEFPTLQAQARKDGTFMQITEVDDYKEAQYQLRKLRGFNDQIAKQKGLRWIFEALVGGDLSDIDPDWFASKTSDNPKDQLPAIKKELAQIIATLMRKKHVIVGHNLLMDLGFIYKTFIGVLPAKVGHFQQMVHEHFPVVIDTKYLATHNTDAMNPRANLKDLLEPFKKVHVPLIVLHEEHTAYGAAYGKEHEAGFDSWMTAELFVKLSAKLYSTSQASFCLAEEDSKYQYSSLPQHRSPHQGPTSRSCTGPQDMLPPSYHATQLNPKAAIIHDTDEEAAVAATEPKVQQWIPDMGDRFWDVYINKLRANAVQGGVCDLASPVIAEEGEEDDGEDY